MTISTATLSRNNPAPVIWLLISAWGIAMAVVLQAQVLQSPSGTLPLRVALSVTAPPLLYLLACRLSPKLRAWVAGRDLTYLVGLQTFRVIGVVFLFVWALGHLPLTFALVAGLGDIAVGIAALSALIAIERQTPGWQARVRTLTIFGILDFVAAFSAAVLTGAGRPLQFAGQPLPIALQAWPMGMVPGFLVPLFIILHLMAWQRLTHADPTFRPTA
jgi:hypothetical protein